MMCVGEGYTFGLGRNNLCINFGENRRLFGLSNYSYIEMISVLVNRKGNNLHGQNLPQPYRYRVPH